MSTTLRRLVRQLSLVGLLAPAALAAQTAAPPKNQSTTQGSGAAIAAAPGVVPTPDYVIGPDDVLNVVFWRDKDISAEVSVRPDGRISLPLLNDIQAGGLTPLELRARITEEAKRYVEDPNVTIVVRQINSRKVFVTGEVAKPGPYMLTGPTTVLQMIATAGGLREYADSKNVVIMRVEAGRTVSYGFNYNEVTKRKNLRQNIELKPGDTIIVP